MSCRRVYRRSRLGSPLGYSLMRLGDSELAVRAVRNHRLTRLQSELGAIELYRDYVGLERHQVGDAPDPGVSLTVRPCRQTCVTDVVVAAQPFIRTEGLVFHEGQRRRIDVGACNVPTRREAGLVKDHRLPGIGDDAVMMSDHEVTRGLADIDAVVAVGGMAHDPFVFFVEGVHGGPGERDPSLQVARVGGQLDVLPRPSRRALPGGPGRVPGREPEVLVPGGMLCAF